MTFSLSPEKEKLTGKFRFNTLIPFLLSFTLKKRYSSMKDHRLSPKQWTRVDSI
jgi:hypothetical protein